MRRRWVGLVGVTLWLWVCLGITPAWAQITPVGTPVHGSVYNVGTPGATLTVSATVPGAVSTDNFNRADGGLGTDWQEGYQADSAQIVSNAVQALTMGVSVTARFIGAGSSSIGSDQYSKITLSSFTGSAASSIKTRVRMAASPSRTYYSCDAWRNGGTFTSAIYRLVNNSTALLVSENATTWAATDTLECRAVGSTISLWRNGAQLLSWSDGALSAGGVGFSIYTEESTLSNTKLDDWEGGSVGAATGVVMTVATQGRHSTAANVPVSGVTFDTVPLLKACPESLYTSGAGTTAGTGVWYLINPNSGTHDVEVTYTGTVFERAATVQLWSGVNLSSVVAACGASGGLYTSSGIGVTTANATASGQLSLASAIETSPGASIPTSETLLYDESVDQADGTDFDYVTTRYRLTTIAGPASMTHIASAFTPAVDYYAQVLAILQPAANTETWTWNEATANTTLFNLERSYTGSGGFQALTTIPGGAGNFQYIASYSAQDNRCNRMNAQNAIGTSPYSNLASSPGFQQQINPATQPNGTVGTTYPGVPITIAQACVPPVTITATGLPPGVSLSTAGIWSGAPTAAGSYRMVITATDSNLDPRSNSVEYPITILPATTISLSPSTQPAGRVGETYAGVGTTVTASGGTAPYTFSCGSTCPPGVTISSGGVWGGIPTNPGTFPVIITATDSLSVTGNISYNILINPPIVLSISPSTQPPGYVSTAYLGTSLSASGGTPPYTFSSSNRPPGVSLSSAGVWSGTPTTHGTYGTLVNVVDSAGSPHNGSITYNILINPAPPPLVLSPTTVAAGTVGTAYTATAVTATGGIAPYSFTATGLAPGVTLSSAGVWGGTPTAAGTFTVDVIGTDSTPTDQGGPLRGTKTYSLLINPNVAIALAPATQPSGVVGFTYSGTTVTASGGTGPYTFVCSGCPTGVSISSGGVWSGSPTVPGIFNATVTATDSLAATGQILYVIGIAPVLAIIPASQPAGFVGTPYAGFPLSASGGTAPYVFSASSLPSGVTLNSNGTWTGAPTTVQSVTTVVTVRDSSTPPGSQNISYPITINPASGTQNPFLLTWSYGGTDTEGALEFPSVWTIEQSTDKFGAFTPIAVLPAVVNGRLVTSYTVAAPPSPIGCWRVKGVDASGNASAYSNIYCRQGDTYNPSDLTPPSKPYSLTGVGQ